MLTWRLPQIEGGPRRLLQRVHIVEQIQWRVRSPMCPVCELICDTMSKLYAYKYNAWRGWGCWSRNVCSPSAATPQLLPADHNKLIYCHKHYLATWHSPVSKSHITRQYTMQHRNNIALHNGLLQYRKINTKQSINCSKQSAQHWCQKFTTS